MKSTEKMIIAYIKHLIQLCQEAIDYRAEFTSNQSGIYDGDIEVEFRTSEEDEHITLEYTSLSGSIMGLEDDLHIIYTSYDSGAVDIEYNYVFSTEEKQLLLEKMKRARKYNYCMDAVKWYQRDKAIEKIAELVSSGQIEFHEKTREIYGDEEFVEAYGEVDYVVLQAEYGDAVYTYTFLDDEDILEEILNTDEDDIAIYDFYVSLAPRLKIEVADYYTHTLLDLSAREVKALMGNDVNMIEVEDVMVRTSMRQCYNKNHEIERLIASVRIISNKSQRIEIVQVDAFYCATCNRYYILESDYHDLKMQGVICCKVVELKDLVNLDHEGWADKSVLKLYGYSVSRKDNLSDQQRRNVLNFVIYNNIMSRERCAEFISWLVRQNSSKPNNESAIEKWNSDINYLNNGYRPAAKNFVIRTIYIK